MKLKHSIAQLALAILGFGVIFRAMTAPSPLWGAFILSLALAVCTLALVGGFYARGLRRASFGGAAICGWIYLFVALGPWSGEQIGPHLATSAAIDLTSAAIGGPSSKQELLDLLETRDQLRQQMKRVARIARGSGQDPAMQRLVGEYRDIQAAVEKYGVGDVEDINKDRWAVWTQPDRIAPTSTSISTSPNFQRIGHGLFAIAFAFAGGAFGRFVARANPEAP